MAVLVFYPIIKMLSVTGTIMLQSYLPSDILLWTVCQNVTFLATNMAPTHQMTGGYDVAETHMQVQVQVEVQVQLCHC